MIVFGDNSVDKVLSKAGSIVELIKEARSRKWRAEGRISIYDNTRDHDHPVRLMNTMDEIKELITHYSAVEDRLIQYYDNTLMKLIPDVLSRSCQVNNQPII